MNVTPHDFRRPLPLSPDLRAEMTQWLARANVLTAEQFVTMEVPAELRLHNCTTAYPSESLSKWSDKSLAFKVVLEGHETPSIVALPSPLGLELVSRLLGDNPTTVEAERPLTPCELAITRFVVETLVKNLSEAWLGDSPLNLRVVDREPNLRRTREFRPTEAFVDCTTTVKTPLGESQWTWFLSNEMLSQMFGLPVRHARPEKGHSSRRQIESLVRDMRTDLVVRLGSAQLSGPQLSALQVGDLVVLDQRVNEPLRAIIRGELKYLGWAGRVGDRQAFEIGSEVRSNRQTSIEPIAEPEAANVH